MSTPTPEPPSRLAQGRGHAMRSHAVIEARLRDDGATALVRMLDSDQLGVRLTTPGRPGEPAVVHLVGLAAGPLGGDEMRVSVLVRAGAKLAVRGSAATLALPGGGASAGLPGRYEIELKLEDGAQLDFAPEPTVVCAGAILRAHTHAELHGDARLRLDERVVLGRFGEPGGDWTGSLAVVRDGVPVVRTTQRSDLLTEAAPGTRAVLALFESHPEPGTARAATSGRAVATPPARGGLLVTAYGPSLTAALADRDRARTAATARPSEV